MTCRSSTGSIITSARVARNGRLCFQVPESVAASHIEQLPRRSRRRCASAAFDSRSKPLARAATPTDSSSAWVRLREDRTAPSCRHSPKTPRSKRACRNLVEAATRRKIQTIAERVEDANTMAVLWQLGVQYIQGYFVHAPEEIVMHAERTATPEDQRPQRLNLTGIYILHSLAGVSRCFRAHAHRYRSR